VWCWRRMEKISWTDHVRNEDVLLRVKEQSNILYEISKGKANWIGHILRRNCLLQRVIEGRIKGGYKWQEDEEEDVGYSHLKEEALDRTMWRVHFGRGFGPVVSQTTKWMNYTILRNTKSYFHLPFCVNLRMMIEKVTEKRSETEWTL